ncbi:substrate-binding domain-containing protein [Treponema primitia]|uniref:sugar ABC transporter substrate-binding protein n=1 Tax=Treponema primitia TaxID=88058 RepID=UPI00397FECB2
MKRLLVIGMALSLMLLAMSCGKSSETNSSPAAAGTTAKSSTAVSAGGSGVYKIGIATREITNDYNRDIISSAQKVVEGAGGSVVIADANADYQKHNENIENLINSGIDGLIIQLGDAQQLTPIVAKATAKKIPVICAGVGAPIPGVLSDLNGDNPLLTVLAADALLSAVGYKGTIYVVYVPGAPLLETRRRIFQSICADFPQVKLIDVPAEHNPAKVQTQIEEILTANPVKGSIAGVYGTYDMLVSGANEAIRRAGRDEIKVIGIDGDKIAFQMLLQDGSPFVTTVVQDSPGIGRQCAEILLGVLNGKIDPSTIAPQIPATCYTATRKNVVEAVGLRWGEGFWNDVQISKDEIIAKYPQTDPVQVVSPTVP